MAAQTLRRAWRRIERLGFAVTESRSGHMKSATVSGWPARTSRSTAGTSAIGAGTNEEYGDSYDASGGGPYAAGHYRRTGQLQIEWLPANFSATSRRAAYIAYAFDQGVLLPNRDYAMTIVKDARTYGRKCVRSTTRTIGEKRRAPRLALSRIAAGIICSGST